MKLIGGCPLSPLKHLSVWFKTAKHRFCLHRFGESALREGFPPQATANPEGQGTLLGVYRWLILSLIAYILAHWAYLSTATSDLPNWGLAAQIALESILPQILVFLLLLDLERMIPLARSHGFDIHISRCKI